jgi:N-acetylneuraminate lyase
MHSPPLRLIAAPYTPLHADGSLNTAVVPQQVELLTAGGVDGAFICGTTGESMSLTIDERIELAKRWVDAAAGRLPVIVHVGHTALADCRTLAAHAHEIGAAAIAAMAPCFAKPDTVEDLVAFCAEIAAAAPDLPFYYYHIPGMTNVNFAMADFLRAATGKIPTLAGLKYSHNDLYDLGACLRMDEGRHEILFGMDQVLVSALALGVRGAVGSTYNFIAPLYRRVERALAAGAVETAAREQARSMELVATCRTFGPAAFAAGKAVMKAVGVDCGPVRPPLRPLSDEQYEQLLGDLDRIGFLRDCVRVAKAKIAAVAER